MNLGIAGKHALVCAASKGLGRGCAFALAREGVNLVIVARRFGRIANITSGAVKAPIDVLGLSNGARAGLTGFVAGLARKTVKHNVTINNLLPGFFDTDRIQSVIGGAAKARGIAYEDALAERIATIPAGRIGDPAEFGHACAFLCSTQAGFITGQNLLLDGGAYPGTF